MGTQAKVKGAVVRESIEYHGKRAQLLAAMVTGIADLLYLCLIQVTLFIFLSCFFTVYLYVYQHPPFLLHGTTWTWLSVKRGHFYSWYLHIA